MTVNAAVFINDRRRVVTLLVKILRHLQNVPRTIFNAKSATLTAVYNNVDLALGDIYLIEV